MTALVPVNTAIVTSSATPSPALVYLARLSPSGRRSQLHALTTMASILSNSAQDAVGLPWAQLRYEHTQALRTALSERYAASTVKRCLAALRGVLRECFQLGLMDADALQRASKLAPIKASPLPKGRALPNGEIRSMFMTCLEDTTPAGVRDAALFAVLYGAGLRRAELVGLDLDDYTADDGGIRVRHGKGDKARITYLPQSLRALVGRWIALRGTMAGPLFYPVQKNGRITTGRLGESSVQWILHERATVAGVADFSPHDLRRTYISNLLDAGADISTVQKLAGHANVTTTQRYDRRGEVSKRAAAERLYVPEVE